MKSAFLILSALVATATASPVASHTADPHPASLSIARRPSAASRGERAKASLAISRARFSALSNGVAKNSVTLVDDVNEGFFFTTITIGNGQSFKIDLDTGSPDLFVPGPACKSTDGSCTSGGKPINLADHTIHPNGETFHNSYGGDTASASGDVYVGPYTLAGVTAKKGFFGVTTSEAGFAMEAQGLLGLSFPFGNTLPHSVTAKVGEVPIVALGLKSFGFYLSNTNQNDSGLFTVNGVDPSHVTGDFNFEEITGTGLWKFNVSHGQYQVGDVLGDLSGAAGNVTGAIADTGSTFIEVPTDVASQIWLNIGAFDDGTGQGTANISCSVAETGPDVVFTFSDTPFNVPASAYVVPNGDGTCAAGIAGGAEAS
ncbi:aspartic peptidase domain-containing protein, partial [Blyttiomyces helicus]